MLQHLLVTLTVEYQRIWRFTILPFFRPDEAFELPYWIPYYGHAGVFFADSHKLITKALLSWDRLVGTYPSLVSDLREPIISLYDLCTDLMANANQMAFFDWALYAIDSHMVVDIWSFTDDLWKLFHQSRFVDTTEVSQLLRQYNSAFKA
ncbi:hypothetical protein BDV12DRAFT_198464 [Aspergillus spectabilis]